MWLILTPAFPVNKAADVFCRSRLDFQDLWQSLRQCKWSVSDRKTHFQPTCSTFFFNTTREAEILQTKKRESSFKVSSNNRIKTRENSDKLSITILNAGKSTNPQTLSPMKQTWHGDCTAFSPPRSQKNRKENHVLLKDHYFCSILTPLKYSATTNFGRVDFILTRAKVTIRGSQWWVTYHCLEVWEFFFFDVFM